jgi:hypothetical protein
MGCTDVITLYFISVPIIEMHDKMYHNDTSKNLKTSVAKSPFQDTMA